MDFKPQDLIFIIVLALLLLKRDARWFVATGLISLALSIPLFAKWIFFTAQHLVYYAFAFFAVAVLMNLLERRK